MKGGNALVHILHSCDYAGNRTYRYDAVHAANSELYDYDQINQIKSLDRGVLNTNKDTVTVSNFTESWDFDKTGNWTQYDKNGTVENRTHNAANELQGIAAHDANGNMTVMPGLKAKYDAWNRMVEVRDSSDNLIARYDYNGVNQRIQKAVGSSVTKSFFNEQWQELESTTVSELTSYIWGLRYIDDLVLRENGEDRLYALADPNWNVVAILDGSGIIEERLKYDAFGKVTWLDENFVPKSESDFAWNRTFTGQVFDAETGLMLYRNRYYHTGLGRFVSRDPIRYADDTHSLYRYVKNNPIIYTDVMGHGILCWLFGIGGPPPSDPLPPGPPPNTQAELRDRLCKFDDKGRWVPKGDASAKGCAICTELSGQGADLCGSCCDGIPPCPKGPLEDCLNNCNSLANNMLSPVSNLIDALQDMWDAIETIGDIWDIWNLIDSLP